MIKLSDYLNYLSSEVIQARKKADLNAIAIAKEYAEHEYLKYFSAPRFTMSSVKMSIPIKVNEELSDTTYNFKRDYKSFVSHINENIAKFNKTEGTNFEMVTEDQVVKDDKIQKAFDQLEKNDYKPERSLNKALAKIDFNKLAEITTTKGNKIKISDTSTSKDRNVKYAEILKNAFRNQFTPVHVDLKELYIDPVTASNSDKGKMLIELNVEMEEEGLKIRSVKNAEGIELEEIVFE